MISSVSIASSTSIPRHPDTSPSSDITGKTVLTTASPVVDMYAGVMETSLGLALGDQGIGADPAQCLSVECAEPDCGGGAVLCVNAGVSPPLLEGLVGEAVVVHSERVVTLAGARGPERYSDITKELEDHVMGKWTTDRKSVV